jgi:hypothetical protein
MTQRAWLLGVVAASAMFSTACSTLPRAHDATVEEVDALAGVELTEAEQAALADAPVASDPVQPENSTEVSWQPNGKNIQLAKLPPVTPVTASMLQLDKRSILLAPPQAAKTDEAPTRGRYKAPPAAKE